MNNYILILYFSSLANGRCNCTSGWTGQMCDQRKYRVLLLFELHDVSIELGKSYYVTGEKVEFDIKALKSAADESYYASIIVSDESSFLEPKEFVMPSLPSMVYFEKEIKSVINEIDRFPDSANYIDPKIFGGHDIQCTVAATCTQPPCALTCANPSEVDTQSRKANEQLDMLLACQDWRKGKLDNLR